MRVTRILAVATAVSLSVGVTLAFAGGWAATTIHPISRGAVAGTPLRVTFTIRQHGRTPVRIDDVALELIAPGGGKRRVQAVPLAETGRYAATVTFPRVGTWRWQVIQGWFAPQPLGTIDVAADRASARPPLDGRSLFARKGCATCHAGPEGAARIGGAPDLAGRFRGPGGFAYVRQSILKPAAVVAPGGGYAGAPSVMPKLEVSRAEAEALARYIVGQR
jgi:cytochrome c551/c552